MRSQNELMWESLLLDLSLSFGLKTHTSLELRKQLQTQTEDYGDVGAATLKSNTDDLLLQPAYHLTHLRSRPLDDSHHSAGPYVLGWRCKKGLFFFNLLERVSGSSAEPLEFWKSALSSPSD